MLVLNRKVGEQIVIGNGDVVIDILAHHSGSIKLGFSAAPEITIDRAEIFKLKSKNKKEAMNVSQYSIK